ncbi:F-box/FBD/LRR-repeat protein At1g13570-like [Ipomoea triloba]|uniref:F-box/FBD/LRR-repeat protein At1g13570-like n=1 Tax=Ipomoea triloba TaxID=35885 RepID=UPI00125D5DCC|nr:F-box/FBD/LRR-repeat protein At1g13570-like [Ipomoea triloba]
MAGKDRISELPVNILDNILGLLPIQEAARTAILSSRTWFSLTKLNFGCNFFDYLCLKYSNVEGGRSESPIFDVINKILMRHNGPIHKIVFDFSEELLEFPFFEEFEFKDRVNLLSYNLNQWFLLLTQNGVEEIVIVCHIDKDARCRVPNCIFSCPTLKRLDLYNNLFRLCCLSSYVEDISFLYCDKIFYFNIVAPKLGSLEIILPECCDYFEEFGLLPPNLDFRSISSLNLECSTCCFEVFIEELNRVGQLFALNVERLMLCISSDDSCLPDNINNSAFIRLLRACPKLCELDLSDQLDICVLKFLKLNPKDFVLMEELSSVARTQKMLRTLKFTHFNGLRSEMQCIKTFLACFPGIEKVVIVRGWIPSIVRGWIPSYEESSDEEFEIMQELLRFPCASTKAEICYKSKFYDVSLVR